MNEKENRIKEQRVIEATRKNLMGMEGKLGVILKFLGQPIYTQGSKDHYINQLTDVYDYLDAKNEDDILELDENYEEILNGYIFDGLTSGMNIEIIYLMDDQKLVTKYKGYNVFIENSGDLQCYVPLEEWELIVDKLFIIAKKKQIKILEIAKAEGQIESQKEKISFLRRLRETWGF